MILADAFEFTGGTEIKNSQCMTAAEGVAPRPTGANGVAITKRVILRSDALRTGLSVARRHLSPCQRAFVPGYGVAA